MEEKVMAQPLGKSGAKKLLANNSSVLILAILWIICFIAINRFGKSFYQIFREASAYGLIAIGLSIVMITGNIDLSVGYQAGVCAVVSIMAVNATGSVPVAVIAALAVGAVFGLLNGTVVTRIGVSPLIATIAMNYIYKGLAYSKTKDGSLTVSGDYKETLKGVYSNSFGAKVLTASVIVIVIVLVVFFFVQKKTNFGNSLYIVGDNIEAGRFAGIKVDNVAHLAYVLCGLCCGLAGFLMSAKDGAAIYTQGDGKDTFAISCCVIGGIKMTGGKGTMVNVLMGVLVMRTITTVLSVKGVSSTYTDLLSGALLIVVLIVDSLSRRGEKK
jgi:ribose/xylose/arabinose/galactoside ABC-type transport system permease subunit